MTQNTRPRRVAQETVSLICSLLQIVSCECTTARVGGARPSTIDAWQCFLLDIRDCIKEWLLCSCCPSLSPSLLIGPWDVEYVSVVLFCCILDIMLCCVWKNKKMLITKKKPSASKPWWVGEDLQRGVGQNPSWDVCKPVGQLQETSDLCDCQQGFFHQVLKSCFSKWSNTYLTH